MGTQKNVSMDNSFEHPKHMSKLMSKKNTHSKTGPMGYQNFYFSYFSKDTPFECSLESSIHSVQNSLQSEIYLFYDAAFLHFNCQAKTQLKCRLVQFLVLTTDAFLLACKQYGLRSDCSIWSSLIWIHTVCYRYFQFIIADNKIDNFSCAWQ